MKKSFWGYNVAEVDEVVEGLEAIKSKLERQIKSLNNELAKIQEELVQERERTFTADNSKEKEELENKYRETVKELNSVRRENSQLTQRNEALSAQIATYDEESLKSGVEQASIICREAYEDMANAKANAKSSMELFVSAFWERFEEYERKIRDVYEELINRNEQTKEDFLHAADEILNHYNNINNSGKELTGHIDSVASLRAEAEQEISALINELIEGDRLSANNIITIPTEKEVEVKYQHSILREISRMHKEAAKRDALAQNAEAASQKSVAESNPTTSSESVAVPEEHHDNGTNGPQESSANADGEYNVNVLVDVDKRRIM